MTPRLLVASLWLVCLALPVSTAPQAGWVSLFDGKSLNGWQASERPESFSVREGAIVTEGDRAHLFYMGPVANHEFKNFEFEAEVMTAPGSNSGIYVHTKFQGPGFPVAGYELQVLNSNPPLPPNAPANAFVEHKMTGSIYAVRNTWRSPVADNTWFRYRIRVEGKTIQTFVNDKMICEYTEPDSPWRPNDKTGRLLGSGTFAFQAHDPGSSARYRNIRVRVLPDALPGPGKPLADPELDELVTSLSNDNFALVDFGLAPATGADRDAQLAAARRYGLSLGDEFPPDVLSRARRPVVVINDRESTPDPMLLERLKAAGVAIAFSSGGDASMTEARLKRRLQAIRAAKLTWPDLFNPRRGE